MENRITTWLMIVLMIVSIIVLVKVTNSNRPIKKLEVTYTHPTNLIDTTSKVSAKFNISYEGQKINYLSFVKYNIRNTGNSPILHSDLMEDPYFSIDYKLLDAMVIAKSDIDMSFSLTYDSMKKHLSFSFPCLNPGEWVSLNTYFDDNVTNVPTLKGRFVGVQIVNKEYRPESMSKNYRYLPFGYIGLSIIPLFLGIILSLPYKIIKRRLKNVRTKINDITSASTFVDWFKTIPRIVIRRNYNLIYDAFTLLQSSDFVSSWGVMKSSFLTVVNRDPIDKIDKIFSIIFICIGSLSFLLGVLSFFLVKHAQRELLSRILYF